MRLLHTTNLTLKNFIGDKIPRYAIISHRWVEDEELSFQEFESGTGRRDGAGWTKIAKGCEIAQSRGLEWLWNDTICIDAKSSAELTEAINSMYKWYERSAECYVFLPDVYGMSECGCREHSTAGTQQRESNGSPQLCLRQFRESTWFTRGWTLQELIAPKSAIFYNARFIQVGTKDSLRQQVSSIANIDAPYLDAKRIFDASIAQKMSWASRRETTREEDIAYSLLGICNVNMPLLYGEGRVKAFVRLQVEIIRKSDDETIFAWSDPSHYWPSLLASSPSAFKDASQVKRGKSLYRSPYDLTNKGIRLSVRRPEGEHSRSFESKPQERVAILLFLNCYEDRRDSRGRKNWRSVAIPALGTPVKGQNIINLAYREFSATREDALTLCPNGTGWQDVAKQVIADKPQIEGSAWNDADRVLVMGVDEDEGGEQWQIYFSQRGL